MKYIEELDKCYEEKDLTFVLKYLNSIIERYQKRIAFLSISISISAIGTIINFFQKINVQVLLKDYLIIFHIMIGIVAMVVGLTLGAFFLKGKMLNYHYKITILEMVILQKEIKQKAKKKRFYFF